MTGRGGGRTAGARDRSCRQAGGKSTAGWRRHLEGWQLAVVAVGIALMAAMVAVPRAAEPDVLPRPGVDHRDVERELRVERERARAAEHRLLPYDVRAVGELMRRYGGAAAADDPIRADRELEDLRRQVRVARDRYGDPPLLRLRAVQSRLFQRALLRGEATGSVDVDLRQLGGDFLRKARESDWIEAAHRLPLSRAERSILFRIRWSGLARLLDRYPFSPTLQDWRVYYGFLLEHPEGRGARHRIENQLSYVTALEKRDPSYLSALARGVLFYQLGEYPAAALALRSHLIRHPDGVWTLRARNYLAAALQGGLRRR